MPSMTLQEKSDSTVMFADISGSSLLYKQHGNVKANSLINTIISHMSEIIASYHGKIIKTIGDEIMASFSNPDRAVKAALELQRTCQDHPGSGELQLRIGIDYGEVIEKKDDLFGETVNNAAYLTSIANRGKVLMTSHTFQMLTHKSRESCSEYDKVVMKGHTHKTNIYRLFWEESPIEGNSGVTQHVGNFEFTQSSNFRTLELIYKDRKQIIDTTNTPFQIGRNEYQSSLFISSEFASRDHCQIIYRRGKFILSDHSTNGTYISQNNQPEIYLRREELPLLQLGEIGIGQPGHDAGSEIILFKTL